MEGNCVPGASSLGWSFVKGPVVLVIEGSKWGPEGPFRLRILKYPRLGGHAALGQKGVCTKWY
jgi:hypothetical protein